MKKVFYSADCGWAVAIVVANDEPEARELLSVKLKERGLEGRDFTLQRVSRAEVGATIIDVTGT